MPHTIQWEETTEYVVALVLSLAVCLTLVVAGLELTTRFFPRAAPKLTARRGCRLPRLKPFAHCSLGFLYYRCTVSRPGCLHSLGLRRAACAMIRPMCRSPSKTS